MTRISVRGWLFLLLGVSSYLLPIQGTNNTLIVTLPWSKHQFLGTLVLFGTLAVNIKQELMNCNNQKYLIVLT